MAEERPGHPERFFVRRAAAHLEDCTKQRERAGFTHDEKSRTVHINFGGFDARLFCAGGAGWFY
jgi:hypothetical protein